MCDTRNRLLAATVARYDGLVWWLMNRPDKGFSEYGIPYSNLTDIPARWAILFGDVGQDQHGRFVRVEEAPRRAPTEAEVAAAEQRRSALAAGDAFERAVAAAIPVALGELATVYAGETFGGAAS